jgi:hypothetical protein
VSREHQNRSRRRIHLVIDEDRASPLEFANNVRVVDDLLAHVDRRTVQGKRPLHRLDGAVDSGAVPPRRREQDSLDQT